MARGREELAACAGRCGPRQGRCQDEIPVFPVIVLNYLTAQLLWQHAYLAHVDIDLPITACVARAA